MGEGGSEAGCFSLALGPGEGGEHALTWTKEGSAKGGRASMRTMTPEQRRERARRAAAARYAKAAAIAAAQPPTPPPPAPPPPVSVPAWLARGYAGRGWR